MSSFKKDVRIIGIYGVAIHNFAIFIQETLCIALRTSSFANASSTGFRGWFYMRANFLFLKSLTKMFTSCDLKFEKKSIIFNLH